MTERKGWTQKEDKILSQIVKQRRIKKWSLIARILEEEFQVEGRTGKQCRQRWHNKLDPKINAEDWTRQEEQKLFDCQNQFGNKWARIAQCLPGRSDNCVKNHFYSTLRKSFRTINRYISKHKKRSELRQFKTNTLTKIITLAQNAFEGKFKASTEEVDIVFSIKNTMILVAQDPELLDNEPLRAEKLLQDIISITKNHKITKPKKKRRTKPVSSSSSSPLISIEGSLQQHDSVSQPFSLHLPTQAINSRAILQNPAESQKMQTAINKLDSLCKTYKQENQAISTTDIVEERVPPVSNPPSLFFPSVTFSFYPEHSIFLANSASMEAPPAPAPTSFFYVNPFCPGVMMDASTAYMSSSVNFSDQLQNSLQQEYLQQSIRLQRESSPKLQQEILPRH